MREATIKNFAQKCRNFITGDGGMFTEGGGERQFYSYIVKDLENGPRSHKCTICGKAYLTKNSFGVHVSRRHRGSGRARDLLNYVFKNEVAAFDEGSTPGTLPSNSQENLAHPHQQR